MQELLCEVQLHLKKVSDDNLETKVEPSRRMEDDPTENNKGAGTWHYGENQLNLKTLLLFSNLYLIKKIKCKMHYY